MTDQSERPSLSVLVVDDARDVRNLVAAHLKRAGHRVELAPDAAGALEAVQEQAFDLAIVDIMMPGMNGYELTQQLRELPRTQDMPILVLSARAGGADRAHAFRVGADAYVQKPFELQRLTDEIAAVMAMDDAA